MKKIIISVAVAIICATFAQAQKAEVLFFKAEMSCCAARACNALEADVKDVVSAKYADGSVVFKTIMISDQANADLVQKHNAKNQTVVAVGKSKNEDLTGIVAGYSRNKNKTVLESGLTEKINKVIK
jgi:hypothetical protein